MKLEEKQRLEQICLDVRKGIAKYGFESGRGHISSALSLVEVLTALYFSGRIDVLKIREGHFDRDRVILSKGHGGLALYLTLIQAGIEDAKIMAHFASAKGCLSTHPVAGTAKGVEMSAGSLGQGLGFACGAALSGKIKGKNYHTYVIVGDGELQEGSNWESMLFASHMGLDKLTLIVDRNQLQISGKVDDIVSLSPLGEKLKAFGFKTKEVDGHDLEQLTDAFDVCRDSGPSAIIANSVKGKGISFIENQNGWHGKGLTEEEYQRTLIELEKADNGKSFN